MKAGTRWLVASFILFASLFLLEVSALADTTPDGFTYAVGTGGVSVIGYTGTDVNLVVPGTIGGQNVVAIGASTFRGKFTLKSVTLPDSVLSLGDYAFDSCYALENLSLGSGLRTIGKYAFSKCYKLATLNLPDGVTAIGVNAFDNDTALIGMELPDHLGSVSSGLFLNCTKLISVTIPLGVDTIGGSAFSGCSSLTGVVIPDGVTTIEDSAFSGCITLSSVSLPGSLINLNSRVFLNCFNLKSVTVPANVEAIPAYAFLGCIRLTSVSLPGGVNSIGVGAFTDCSSLTDIVLPEGLTSIPNNAFEGCESLGSINWPSTLTTIGSYAFENCKKLSQANLPIGFTSLGEGAFSGCSALSSVSLPAAGLMSIKAHTFKNCSSLGQIDLPDGLISIGSYAFSGCGSLSDLDIPDGVFSIGEAAFLDCAALKAIDIPDGVTSICDFMFDGCSQLASVNLPEGVTSIGIYAFSDCDSLKSIDLPDGVTSIGIYAFKRSGLTGIDIPDGVTCIDEGLLEYSASLTHVGIPDSVTSIDSYAFYDCTNLAGVDLPSGVKSIGDNAFLNSGLTSVYIPDGATSIGDYAFALCDSLKSARLPDSVTALGDGAFAYNDSLTAIRIPSGLTSIGNQVFDDCDDLASVDIPYGLTSIGSLAFAYCKSLVDIDIPDSVTSLGSRAFDSCYKMAPIELPKSIASIGDGCFNYTYMCFYVYSGSYAQQYLASRYPSRTVTMGIELDPSPLTLGVGALQPLTATVMYSRPGYTIEWESNAPAVASVALNGTVTGVSAGSATITAVLDGHADLTATCQVNVRQYVTGVTLDRTQMTIYTGSSLTLIPAVSPANVYDGSIIWSSNNTPVATVSTSGVVTAQKAGNATITATAADGSGKSATCEFIVKQYTTGVGLDRTSASLYEGDHLTLQATVSPDDTSEKGIDWATGNEAVASVSTSGVVTAIKAGDATITATAADGSGKSATCVITVWAPASGVTIDPAAEALLKPGDVLTLTANVQPENAHDRSVTWSTSNASVARMDGGVVTAVARGTATITATTHNGKTATCTVAVEDRVVDLTLSVPEGTPEETGAYSLPVKATLQIGAGVKPEGIGYDLTYKSSDAKVASVSKSGLITGLKNGQAIMIVTAKDLKGLASKSKTLKINVFTPVGSVSLPGEARILTGAVKRLTATVSPSSASDKALTWASDNETVATVAQDGTVTANAPGTANIAAKAASGQAASCLVRVTDPVQGIEIATETGDEYVNYKESLQLSAAVQPGTANAEVTWKSSNTDCVTVGADGRAYGRKVGKATIYATAADGTGVRGSVTIQVITPVTGVKLPETDKVFIGKSKKLTTSLSPSNPTFKTLVWESSNEAVVTVEQDGTVTAVTLGTAVITATAYNGRSDSCTITVTQPVEKITITQEDGYVVVYKGKTVPLNAAIAPDNASEQGVTWKSSNTKYATVNERGEVTGKAAGKVTITATAKDGSGVSDSINLTIVTPETAIKLSRSSAILYHNGETDALKTISLTASALPKGARYRTLTWSIVSGDAATVDETTGLVTALKEGIAVIRATTDREHYADCTVTVRTLPASFTLNTTEKTLAFKQSFDLGAEAAFDAECTEPALTWNTDNKKVATVSSTGVVKASKSKTGKVTITAKSKNGKVATCTVTVVKSLPNGKDVPDASVAEVTAPRITLKLTGGGYATSDDHVADVDGHGEVTLKQDGTVMLEAGGRQIGFIVEDGNLWELKVDEGAELLLKAGLDARWTVKDGEIAAIDRDGRLTALCKGTTTLTCQANDGGEWTIRIIVTGPNEDEPQTNPEPSTETEAAMPEQTPSTELIETPDPEPTIVPTEPEPSVEPDPTAKPEPEKAPDSKPDMNPAPAPVGAGAQAGAEG